jgi:hypothetical protein
MYPAVIKAIRSGFYVQDSDPRVVNTSNGPNFRRDFISVAEFDDHRRLPYSLWYILEVKLHLPNVLTPYHCGRFLDYFHSVHKNQPRRDRFMGILSDCDNTWVFTACYETQDLPRTVEIQPAPSLADAIIYVDEQCKWDIGPFPVLDKPFTSDYRILTVSNLHFVLEVPTPESTKPVSLSTTRTTEEATSSITNQQWRPPSIHPIAKSFVLKAAKTINGRHHHSPGAQNSERNKRCAVHSPA